MKLTKPAIESYNKLYCKANWIFVNSNPSQKPLATKIYYLTHNLNIKPSNKQSIYSSPFFTTDKRRSVPSPFP